MEQIDDRLVREYTKIAAMPDFRASVDLAKKFLRIEDGPPKKKAAKAKRKPASAQKKLAKRPKAKK